MSRGERPLGGEELLPLQLGDDAKGCEGRGHRTSRVPGTLDPSCSRTESTLDQSGQLNHRGDGTVGEAQPKCPRHESNMRTRFRKPLLYPLSYGGSLANGSGSSFLRSPCLVHDRPAGRPARADARLAEQDERVVAAAAVGSLAVGSGDRFSDLDLTFAIADGASVAGVLEDWTHTLAEEHDAVRIVDLEVASTIYRVFLLPGALQFDLSLTPARDFRPAGPRFQLLLGATAAEEPGASARPAGALSIPTPAVAGDIFGWAVIYALHARACIERGRVWQAEHYVGAVRDHGLALACLTHGIVAVQARGYDDLPPETLARLGARGGAPSGACDLCRRSLRGGGACRDT